MSKLRQSHSRSSPSSTESDSFEPTAPYKDEEDRLPHSSGTSGSNTTRRAILYAREEGAGASTDDDTEEEVKRPLNLPRGDIVKVRSRGSRRTSTRSGSKRKSKRRSYVMRSVGDVSSVQSYAGGRGNETAVELTC